MKKNNLFIIIFTMFFTYSMPSIGAVLNIENGALLGAEGVNINGTMYNVTFQGAPCTLLFNGCNDTSDFFFTDVDSGQAANLALLNQVFKDTLFGLFDSNPNLTNGCTASTSYCSVITPISPSATGFAIGTFLNNSTLESGDYYTGIWSNIGIEADFGSTRYYPSLTYAVWSGPSPVPVPASVWLFCSGLIALVGMRKKSSS